MIIDEVLEKLQQYTEEIKCRVDGLDTTTPENWDLTALCKLTEKLASSLNTAKKRMQKTGMLRKSKDAK